MTELLAHPLLIVLTALLLFASIYYAAICFVAWRFQRAPAVAGRDNLPPVSILKPVRGLSPSFYESIRSHAMQDYPEFEILFGVANLDDPAVESVRRLAGEFSNLRIKLIVCGAATGGNPKVYCLERLAAQARYETLLVNDSDIRVGRDYLRQIAFSLQNPDVGMVTCLYRAAPGGTFWSLLEALWISAEFQGQVLLARSLQGMRFALGATMLFRRRDLQRIGGFEALRAYLADDYILGNRIAKLGFDVAVAAYPVETLLPDESFSAVWRHLLRWARTIRISRPQGHAGLIVTHGTVWSLLGLALGGGNLVLSGFASGCIALRLLAAWLVGRGCVGSRLLPGRLYLMPLADLLSFLVWCWSFLGNRVHWGNQLFRLNRLGEIVALDERNQPGRERSLRLLDDAGSANPADL